MSKALGYLRVSGPGQLRGDGFARQQVAIETYAKRNGITLVKTFRERAIPGATDLENRPALMALLDALAADGCKLVLIERLDRLARDLMVQESIIGDLRKRGFEIVSVNEPDLCANDPSRKLMRQIFGAIAEYDKAMLVAKLRGAKERMRLRGERTEGAFPFGHDKGGHHKGEQKVLRRLQELKASGLTYAQVVDAANREGLPTRFGKRWHLRSVYRILNRNTNVLQQASGATINA
jgi:DNA invertase Pin-like site-specific DNA recombinase